MAEAKKAAPAAPEPGAEPKKKSVIAYVIVALLVVLIAVIGGGIFVLYKLVAPPPAVEEVAADDGHGDASKEKKKEKKASKDKHDAPPVFAKLDTFTVNLAGGASVLQTEIHVQVADEKMKDVVTSYMPRISSQVNLLLSSKKPEDIATMEAKVKLMEEIKAAINRVLGAKDDDEGVKSVEFKTFIVQ
jgi:flagellar FliL protein